MGFPYRHNEMDPEILKLDSEKEQQESSFIQKVLDS
jgi:hypothetical protein